MVPPHHPGEWPLNVPGPDKVASPCVGVCRLRTATNLCEGCLRTVAEITEWSGASPTRRREILGAVAGRQATGSAVAAEPARRLSRENGDGALFRRVETD